MSHKNAENQSNNSVNGLLSKTGAVRVLFWSAVNFGMNLPMHCNVRPVILYFYYYK